MNLFITHWIKFIASMKLYELANKYNLYFLYITATELESFDICIPTGMNEEASFYFRNYYFANNVAK